MGKDTTGEDSDGRAGRKYKQNIRPDNSIRLTTVHERATCPGSHAQRGNELAIVTSGLQSFLWEGLMIGFKLLDKTSTGRHHQTTEFVTNTVFFSGEFTLFALRFVHDLLNNMIQNLVITAYVTAVVQ